jgi:hypothetical protein
MRIELYIVHTQNGDGVLKKVNKKAAEDGGLSFGDSLSDSEGSLR